MDNEIKGRKDDEKKKQLSVSAEALKKLFESIELEGEEYEKVITRPTERSSDTWGLKREGEEYVSDFSIDIIEDELGNRKQKVIKF